MSALFNSILKLLTEDGMKFKTLDGQETVFLKIESDPVGLDVYIRVQNKRVAVLNAFLPVKIAKSALSRVLMRINQENAESLIGYLYVDVDDMCLCSQASSLVVRGGISAELFETLMFASIGRISSISSDILKLAFSSGDDDDGDDDDDDDDDDTSWVSILDSNNSQGHVN